MRILAFIRGRLSKQAAFSVSYDSYNSGSLGNPAQLPHIRGAVLDALTSFQVLPTSRSSFSRISSMSESITGLLTGSLLDSTVRYALSVHFL